MIAVITQPEITLKQDCPIAWPGGIERPTIDPERAQLDWIRSRYEQTVYLPEVSRQAHLAELG